MIFEKWSFFGLPAMQAVARILDGRAVGEDEQPIAIQTISVIESDDNNLQSRITTAKTF